MKELGNLAIVVAQKKDVLLQVLNGTVTVHLGRILDKVCLTADWHDDEKINEIIRELNFGKYAKRNGGADE